jgi:hypothetical protein
MSDQRIFSFGKLSVTSMGTGFYEGCRFDSPSQIQKANEAREHIMSYSRQVVFYPSYSLSTDADRLVMVNSAIANLIKEGLGEKTWDGYHPSHCCHGRLFFHRFLGVEPVQGQADEEIIVKRILKELGQESAFPWRVQNYLFVGEGFRDLDWDPLKYVSD